jgi:hypothetical protein
MFRDLTDSDTLSGIFPEFTAYCEAESEARRKAAFDKARTQEERLMVLGVIVSCDDEMEASFRWEGQRQMAIFYGLSGRQVSEEAEDNKARERLINFLSEAVEYGETREERRERIQAALALAPKGQKTDRKGKVSKCSHRALRTCRGWERWPADGEVDPRSSNFMCWACGATCFVPHREEPTPNAVQAARLLKQEPSFWAPVPRLTRMDWSTLHWSLRRGVDPYWTAERLTDRALELAQPGSAAEGMRETLGRLMAEALTQPHPHAHI